MFFVNVSCALDPRSVSPMVFVGISKLGCTDLVFVDPGIKINGAYYRQNSYTTHDARGIRGRVQVKT